LIHYHGVDIYINKRLPLAIADIMLIHEHCKTIHDDMRWLEALISDIGVRLSEAAS
jgi:hypothetical protein